MAVIGVQRPVEVEQDMAGAGMVLTLSSLTFVLPPDVATDRVACPPAFSIFWKTSSKRVSSSHVLMSESETNQKCFWSTEAVMSLHFLGLSSMNIFHFLAAALYFTPPEDIQSNPSHPLIAYAATSVSDGVI